MQLYEKIREDFADTKNMTKQDIMNKCKELRYTPCSIEKDWNLVGDNIEDFTKRLECKLNCGECLNKYLLLELEERKGK